MNLGLRLQPVGIERLDGGGEQQVAAARRQQLAVAVERARMMSSTTHEPHHRAAMCEVPTRAGVHYAEVTVTGTRDSPDACFMFGVGPKGMDVDKMPFAQSMPFWGLLSADGSCHYQRGGLQPTVPEMWRWKGRRRTRGGRRETTGQRRTTRSRDRGSSWT